MTHADVVAGFRDLQLIPECTLGEGENMFQYVYVLTDSLLLCYCVESVCYQSCLSRFVNIYASPTYVLIVSHVPSTIISFPC